MDVFGKACTPFPVWSIVRYWSPRVVFATTNSSVPLLIFSNVKRTVSRFSYLLKMSILIDINLGTMICSKNDGSFDVFKMVVLQVQYMTDDKEAVSVLSRSKNTMTTMNWFRSLQRNLHGHNIFHCSHCQIVTSHSEHSVVMLTIVTIVSMDVIPVQFCLRHYWGKLQ